MDNEVKQRNRRRKRAQRMQAQRDSKAKDGDSGEDESPVREKPQRPPNRRKKSKEPLVEEDIVDGFAILGFKSYEDLESVIKLATKAGIRRLTAPVIDEKYKLEKELQKELHKDRNVVSNHLIPAVHTATHGLSLSHNDPGTSDDSGRASERLTGSSVAPRDPDSSRDRLSDASSRCSSGKGYICDSEGEDDKFEDDAAQPTPSVSDALYHLNAPSTSSCKPSVSGVPYEICNNPSAPQTGSDAGSVLFASTPSSRKLDFPGSLSSLGNGDSAASPVPAPTPPSMAPPTPSPAPAALPPPQQQYSTPATAQARDQYVAPVTQHQQPMPNATQHINTGTPHISASTPHIGSNTPHIGSNTPLMGSNTPLIGSNTPHITSSAAHIPAAPHIACSGAHMTVSQSHLTSVAAHQPPSQPPHVPPISHAIAQHIVSAVTSSGGITTPSAQVTTCAVLPPPKVSTPQPAVVTRVPTPPSSVPVTMPQPAPAAAPTPVVHLPQALDSTADVTHGRTDSPAVATSANVAVAPGSGGSTYPAFPSLYAPYAVHSPYTAPSPAPAPATMTATPPAVPTTTSSAIVSIAATVAAVTVTTTSHRDTVTSSRAHSPRGHSPNRERDSYSSNVSSLSRGSLTPFSTAPTTSSLTYTKPTALVWPAAPTSTSGGGTQLSPAATSVPPRPTPPLATVHPFPTPMFAPPPLPPPTVSTASPLGLDRNVGGFSAESLFQSNQADMLRRELDSRFLASQDRSMNVGPPPYLRAEMHQHQHHHTHVHQHTTPLLPPPPASSLFPAPLRYVNETDPSKLLGAPRANTFKEIPKMGSVDSPFYRQNLGLSSFPAYSPVLPSGLGGPTPFVPPNHLPTFQPKQPLGDASKLKPVVKTGKWNAMHVRVAWEIYHHQQKQQSEVKAGLTPKADLLRPPSHMLGLPGSLMHNTRPHDLAYPPLSHRTTGFDPTGSLFSGPSSHLSSGMSPFTRYTPTFNPSFSLSPFTTTRDLPPPPLGPLHDPWSRLAQRSVPGFPPAPVPQSPWGLKPDPAAAAVLEQRREREERERRDREERERREREEKQRKQLEQQQQERERERREKERREMERREMERERERERLLHQQRLAESNKQAAALAARDRSPLRQPMSEGSMSEVRVKEEPRAKDDDVMIVGRTEHRYHPYMHPGAAAGRPLTHLERSRMLPPPPPLAGHYAPPPHWPADPYYPRFEPPPPHHLRYNPLMEAAIRAEEERAKMLGAYGHLRGAGPWKR